MALTKISDVFQLPETLKEIELSVSDLNSSVLTIAGDVQELELSVADLSASVLEVKGDITSLETLTDKITKKYVLYGNLFGLALNDGHVALHIPVIGDISFTNVSISKASDVNGVIYGDKGYTGCTFGISANISNNTISLNLIPSVNLSTYVTAATGFCFSISDKVIFTLS